MLRRMSLKVAHRDGRRLTANRRFRGIADMEQFSAPDEL